MCDDTAREQIARFLDRNNLSWPDWLQVASVNPTREDCHLFKSKVIKFQVTELNLNALIQAPDLVHDGMIDIKLLESQIRNIYLPRIRNSHEIRQGFLSLLKGEASAVQIDQLQRELFGDGSQEGFALRCGLKGVPSKTAQLMATVFR